MAKNTLSITDNRTQKSYEIDVENDTVRALDLRQIRVQEDDFGLMTYDPGFSNTAACKSRITFIDGDKGILRHRGYPIDQLAERTSFLDVAYLIFHGELPSSDESAEWRARISRHRTPPDATNAVLSGFPQDCYAMGTLSALVSTLSAVNPGAREISDAERRREHLVRLIAQIPALGARVYRHKLGMPIVNAASDEGFTSGFLRSVFEGQKPVEPVFVKALDVLFILHADHEQNCSANAMRSVGSSRPDPYLAASAAIGALAGPLHGGANEAVLKMLAEIGSVDRVPTYIDRVKEGEFRLMGFGHRVYKNYDPRARIIKGLADEVLAIAGANPLLDIAMELEKIALRDEYFVGRKLYPNVDFYSGLIYQAMGFPTWMFPVLFAIGRMCGWVSQWEELVTDPEQRIARPRQVYLGENLRSLD